MWASALVVKLHFSCQSFDGRLKQPYHNIMLWSNLSVLHIANEQFRHKMLQSVFNFCHVRSPSNMLCSCVSVRVCACLCVSVRGCAWLCVQMYNMFVSRVRVRVRVRVHVRANMSMCVRRAHECVCVCVGLCVYVTAQVYASVRAFVCS